LRRGISFLSDRIETEKISRHAAAFPVVFLTASNNGGRRHAPRVPLPARPFPRQPVRPPRPGTARAFRRQVFCGAGIFLCHLNEQFRRAEFRQPETDLRGIGLRPVFKKTRLNESANHRPVLVALGFFGPYQIGQREQITFFAARNLEGGPPPP